MNKKKLGLAGLVLLSSLNLASPIYSQGYCNCQSTTSTMGQSPGEYYQNERSRGVGVVGGIIFLAGIIYLGIKRR